MKSDEARWDERYLKNIYPTEPSKAVKEFFKLATKGKALDIAAGTGRNSVFLARQGFEVDAVDISGLGISKIEESGENINLIHEDLDCYRLKPDAYSLIVNVNFLQRRLFPCIKEALKKNGVLIFKTFLETYIEKDRIGRSDRYLKSNELLHSFLSLKIIYYKEEKTFIRSGEPRETATLAARKTDVN